LKKCPDSIFPRIFGAYPESSLAEGYDPDKKRSGGSSKFPHTRAREGVSKKVQKNRKHLNFAGTEEGLKIMRLLMENEKSHTREI